jgi:hypothetical protein
LAGRRRSGHARGSRGGPGRARSGHRPRGLQQRLEFGGFEFGGVECGRVGFVVIERRTGPRPVGAESFGEWRGERQCDVIPGCRSHGHTPQPQSNGHKTIQSAQLNLSTAPSRVDEVAQEAFNVIGQENGIVNRSSVTQTGSADGNAFMQLSVPSSALAQTMTKLSQLTYARVASRTDNSQDVNNQYIQAKRRLADAQALRTSLLKQLANAVTTEQVDSLKAQIRDAGRSISSDESSLAALNHRIAYSNISLTIFAGAQPPVTPTHHGSSGFTLGKATHDAGRVLVVVAGVLLIGLAVLLPVAAIAALAWWVGGMVTHRRRERALDLA